MPAKCKAVAEKAEKNTQQSAGNHIARVMHKEIQS